MILKTVGFGKNWLLYKSTDDYFHLNGPYFTCQVSERFKIVQSHLEMIM